MNKQITSIQNPLVKEIIQLQEKSRNRKKKELFIIEGFREIYLALKGGYTITTLLYCDAIISFDKIEELLDFTSSVQVEIIEISKDVYQKIAHRKTTEGVIAFSKTKNLVTKKVLSNISGANLEVITNIPAIISNSAKYNKYVSVVYSSISLTTSALYII